MKAIYFTKYGTPEMLELREVEKPAPGKNEVLIKIVATAVNDYDWSMVQGKPYLYRLIFGIIRPKKRIPGMELAGIVEAVGSDVKEFKPGDAVYGDISDYGFGSYAEYVCVNEKAVHKKPEQMNFEEAASIPHASLLAWQALHDVGNIQQGQKVLLNGGGGGVGTFAFQLAKLYGCEVTGVDTGNKLDMMHSMGFDKVIDYKKQDFTKNGEQYDLVLDCKTNRSPFSYIRSLKPNGMYVTVGGKLNRLLQFLFFKGIISLFYKKNFKILALKPNKGLDHISQLYLMGKIKCIIDGPYPLAEAGKHIRYFGEGKHRGKVVLTV